MHNASALVKQKLPSTAKSLDRASYARKLRECASKEALDHVCNEISRSNFRGDTSLGNIQLELYSSLGCVDGARSAFDRIRTPNTFSWNHIINAYTRNGHLQHAKDLFARLPIRDSTTWNCLMSAFSRQGDLATARYLFDRNRYKDTVSWNAMIAAYARSGHLSDAMELFHRMKLEGFRPNQLTFLGTINACSSYAQARTIELSICEAGLAPNPVPSTALIETYAQFGTTRDAWRVFNRAAPRDKILWTAMLSAYAKRRSIEELRALFQRLPHHDLVTATIALSTLAAAGNLGEAEEIFRGMLHHDGLCETSMAVAYAQAGDLPKARAIFDSMANPHVISWNVMITAYAQRGHGREALDLFKLMEIQGEQPTIETVSAIFDACAALGLFPQGKLLHASFAGSGIESDHVVGTSLVAMYGRCGNLGRARELFDAMPYKNILTWTSMVGAYAQHGHGRDALGLFHAMALHGEAPDDIVFKNVIYACGQAGVFAQVWKYFQSIQGDHGIAPGMEHYKIMIDLLARAGKGSWRQGEGIASGGAGDGVGAVWRRKLCARNAAWGGGRV
ncbi:pentatricopeptide repeat-containing protein At4g02750-like [Selaginella moellendorffii]|uniref:pentatricopeptide repeat-containing protein At4g02750-like n=1 Tax=Selaginella moellendorffii TaxID=88036 RepID=UPI000D1CDB8F|nr:pentatricopeptide repeat-containing protein At4g02750-like [Selaginella moellendorffii]|eukprot:XP_024533675.1 pentatricopeptide repeat-containing protein At4g02750-like [Selaginella moellendorffii]